MRNLWRGSQIFWLTTTKNRMFVSAFSAFPRSIANVHQRSTSTSRTTTTTTTTQCQATTNLVFETSLVGAHDYNSTMVVGKKAAVESLLPELLERLELSKFTPPAVVKALSGSLDIKTGGSASTILATTGSGSDDNDDNDASVHKLVVAGLPTKLSRNNHPMAVHSLTRVVGSAVKGDHSRLVVLTDDFAIGPLALAIAKAFPLFGKKSSKRDEGKNKDKTLHITFVKSDGSVVTDAQQLQAAQVVAKYVRLAGRLVDSHPELLTTTQFSKEVQQLVSQFPSVTMTEIIGTELATKGYGGIYGVGKAANCPPRMIILQYNGATNSSDGDGEATETVALVGKGIVYDTGGLSLKSKTGMSGMKHDMGGAAGVLGGFFGAVELKSKKNVTCILCLAENAIGPNSFRNDDILELYSGKTVEINNCDAEGRLVLGDGVAHATRHIPNLDLVVDMATLTGAQLIATGKKHAGILCNTLEVERRALQAGLHSGDLCYPLLYAPELLFDEFKSEVADMKNSVKDRSNAQTSCAGHFIEAHLHENYQGGWLHVDMAGPGTNGARGTGYGVGLVMSLLETPGF